MCLGVFGGIGLLVASLAAWKLYKKRLVHNRNCRSEASLNTRNEEEAGQRNQRQVDAIREERVSRGPRPSGDDIPDVLQCVVCLGAEREVNGKEKTLENKAVFDFALSLVQVILLPCGHVCACADCAAELLRMNQGCPVCRFFSTSA